MSKVSIVRCDKASQAETAVKRSLELLNQKELDMVNDISSIMSKQLEPSLNPLDTLFNINLEINRYILNTNIKLTEDMYNLYPLLWNKMEEILR